MNIELQKIATNVFAGNEILKILVLLIISHRPMYGLWVPAVTEMSYAVIFYSVKSKINYVL
jgi:hypothetical protein